MIPKFPHDLVGPVVPDDVGGVLVVQGRSGWRLFVDSESIKQAVYVYRPVFDPDGVIVDLEVVMVNEAARGVPLSTHIVEGVLTSNVFVDHGTALDAANSVWRGEPVPTYHVERRGFHTGQPIVVHYEVATLRVENYLVQVSVDHTTVTQLASADTRFKLMAEASSSALVLLSLDSGSGAYLIVYANPAAFKDVPGLRIGANLPVSIDEIIVGSIEELRAGAIVRHLWTREVLVRRVVVEATITPVGTDELMLSWRELTSEQLAVAELERSDRVLQAIGAGAFGTIVVYEPSFDDGTLAALTMLWSASGRSSTGAAALEPEAVVSSSDVLKMAQSMLAGGDVTRSGWVSLALTGDVERSVEFTLVYAGDRFVLEFVERTDELKARSTLASVNATTEAHRSFLSRVSHEMRSPLNVIHGYSQLLGRLQLPEAAVGYVASIDRGVGRMVQIVDDLLLLGQLDQGLLTLDNQLVTVDELLARLMVALPDEPWWIDGAVTRIETAPQDTRVRTDPSRWCTAVALVLEASRNIAPHEALELGAFVRGGRAGMQVVARSDSAVVDELWVPFAKSHTIPGAGLGLAVARGIMRVLGADTDVRPSPVDSSRTSLVLTVPPAD